MIDLRPKGPGVRFGSMPEYRMGISFLEKNSQTLISFYLIVSFLEITIIMPLCVYMFV